MFVSNFCPILTGSNEDFRKRCKLFGVSKLTDFFHDIQFAKKTFFAFWNWWLSLKSKKVTRPKQESNWQYMGLKTNCVKDYNIITALVFDFEITLVNSSTCSEKLWDSENILWEAEIRILAQRLIKLMFWTKMFL